jgi:hypothetical protein
MADAGLDHLAPWLEGYLQRLAPSERRKLTRRLAKALRDANARRIRDNVEPDGTPMQPRKSKRDRRGRLRKRKGRMFPKTSLAATCASGPARRKSWCPSGNWWPAPQQCTSSANRPRRSPHPQLDQGAIPREAAARPCPRRHRDDRGRHPGLVGMTLRK